jgi:hypothetical protein
MFPACFKVNFFFQWLYSPRGPWPLFRFPDLFTGGRTPWTSDQLVARPLPQHTTTKTQKNTYTHHLTSMPKAGFQPAITASERSKTVHASDRSATATGFKVNYNVNITTLHDITSNRAIEFWRRLGRTHCLHPQGQTLSQGRSQQEESDNQSLTRLQFIRKWQVKSVLIEDDAELHGCRWQIKKTLDLLRDSKDCQAIAV